MEGGFVWYDQVYLCLNAILLKIYGTTIRKRLKLFLFLRLQQEQVCSIWETSVSPLCLSTTISLLLWDPETFAWRNNLIDSSVWGIYYLHWLSTKQAFVRGLLLLRGSQITIAHFSCRTWIRWNTEVWSNTKGARLAPTEKPTLANTA